jgi:hypothetical protein
VRPAAEADVHVGPGHLFAHFAEAIIVEVARWGFSCVQLVELADGLDVGSPTEAGERGLLDHTGHQGRAKSTRRRLPLPVGLGDNWRHTGWVPNKKAI